MLASVRTRDQHLRPASRAGDDTGPGRPGDSGGWASDPRGRASEPRERTGDPRAELGDFLRQRRERLTPGQVGLPGGDRRRTPGLRRDEVAGLAHMSTVYYERLEQGRGPSPSATVLAGMSAALRLTADEQDHLFLLAGQAPPARCPADDEPDPELAYVLHEVAGTTPGFMSGELGGLIAQNRLNVLLFGDRVGQNLIRLWFTDQGWRDRLDPPEQQADTSLAYVADLRAAAGRRGADAEAAALVAELRAASAEFAELWDRHPVSALHCSAKVVHDPRVGRLDLECSVLTSASSRQRLLLMKAAPGTPTAGRLAALSTYS